MQGYKKALTPCGCSVVIFSHHRIKSEMLLKLKGLLKLITVQCDMDILKGDSRILIVLCKNERGGKRPAYT